MPVYIEKDYGTFIGINDGAYTVLRLNNSGLIGLYAKGIKYQKLDGQKLKSNLHGMVVGVAELASKFDLFTSLDLRLSDGQAMVARAFKDSNNKILGSVVCLADGCKDGEFKDVKSNPKVLELIKKNHAFSNANIADIVNRCRILNDRAEIESVDQTIDRFEKSCSLKNKNIQRLNWASLREGCRFWESRLKPVLVRFDK